MDVLMVVKQSFVIFRMDCCIGIDIFSSIVDVKYGL